MFRSLNCPVDLLFSIRAQLLGKKYNIEKDIPIDAISLSNSFASRILSSCTKADGVIDGAKLSELNFPLDAHYDVFISYSHSDEEIACFLYAFMKRSGIKCFLDSTIWHSADTLLQKIDDKYSLSEPGSKAMYNYTKRNFSTSHVHAMLSMAMLDAIDRSDLCIFINSKNSISLKNGIEQGTLSPWIYEELKYSNLIRQSVPSWVEGKQVRTFSSGGVAQENLQVMYKVNTPMATLTIDDMETIFQNQERMRALQGVYKNHGFISDKTIIR